MNLVVLRYFLLDISLTYNAKCHEWLKWADPLCRQCKGLAQGHYSVACYLFLAQ